MSPDPQTLAELLSMAGLIAGTTEYAEIIKRRAAARREADLREDSGDVGLQGLVRVLLTDGDAAAASPVPE